MQSAKNWSVLSKIFQKVDYKADFYTAKFLYSFKSQSQVMYSVSLKSVLCPSSYLVVINEPIQYQCLHFKFLPFFIILCSSVQMRRNKDTLVSVSDGNQCKSVLKKKIKTKFQIQFGETEMKS